MKIKKIMVILLVSMTIIGACVSCSQKDNTNSASGTQAGSVEAPKTDILTGTWKLVKAISDGKEVSLEKLSLEMTMEFSDGIVKIMSSEDKDGESQGDYTISGDKVTITSDGNETMEGTIGEKTLTFEQDKITLQLEKQ